MATKTISTTLEERLSANPDSLGFARLAEQYRAAGDIAKAIDLCVSGNKKHPGYVTGRIVLGRCYADLDNFDEAVEAFSEVCRLDRRNMVAMKMLADIFMRLGHRKKAGDLYALLAAMDPWSDTLSRMASRSTEPQADDGVEVLRILKPAPSTRPGESPAQPAIPTAAPIDISMEISTDVSTDLSKDMPTELQMELTKDAPTDLSLKITPEKEAVPAIDAAAQKAVTQEVTKDELGITDVVMEKKDEAVLETAENIQQEAQEALFESTTVSGNDITDRMAMLFGRMPEDETPVAEELVPPAQEPSAKATEDTVETVEVQPIDTIPDGNTISSRIDELFGRETLKMPAIKEAKPPIAPKDGAEEEAFDATISLAAPDSVKESEFEETMIMDAQEVKEFFREEQKTDADRPGSGSVEGPQSDLISEPPPSEETTPPEDLIIDEKGTAERVGLLEEEALAVSGISDDTVTGDDVVRLMSGFFDEQEGRAISEIVGPETTDDIFSGSELVVEPLPRAEGPGEIDAVAAPPGSAKAPLTREVMPVADDTISGDDVARRIERYFGKGAAGSEASAPPTVEDDGEEATLVESIAEEAATVTDGKARGSGNDSAPAVSDDAVSGDDVVTRLDGMFSGSEEAGRAAMSPKDSGDKGEQGIDDTRVVDAGRPSETDLVEDTVAEIGGGLISGADIEERLEEYFHDAADRSAAEKKALAAALIREEEAAYPEIPKGADVDKKTDFEETIIVGDAALAGLSIDQIVGDETVFADRRPEGPEVDKEATAVFTDFTASGVVDAPQPPPDVPLFTVEKSRLSDEDAITEIFALQESRGPDIAAIPAVPESPGPDFTEIPDMPEPPEPDIPDHVLTPTLADIYLQQGQPKLALTIYRRLRDKQPDNKKLEARIIEIEKSIADGTVFVQPEAPKPAVAARPKKTAVKKTAQKAESEDKRPLAGVRLKKKPKLNWKKNKKS